MCCLLNRGLSNTTPTEDTTATSLIKWLCDDAFPLSQGFVRKSTASEAVIFISQQTRRQSEATS